MTFTKHVMPLVAVGVLATAASSHAAVTIQIYAADNDKNISMTITGSLGLTPGFSSSNRNVVSVTNSSGSLRGFGETVIPSTNSAFDGASLGDWAKKSEIVTVQTMGLGVNFNWAKGMNSGNFSDTVDGFRFSASDGFVLDTVGFNTYNVDQTTSTLAFNGTMTFQTSDFFSDTFNKGTYVSQYNGQNVTLIVSNQFVAPEPSSSVLFALGGVMALTRRRRS